MFIKLSNNNMSKLYLFLSALSLLCLLASPQIIVPTNSTLIETIQGNSINDTDLTKAYISILQTHPQLAHFNVYNVSQSPANTSGTDYYITLKGTDNSTVLVTVSLESNTSSFFVSYFEVDRNGMQTVNSTPSYQIPQVFVQNSNQSPQAILTNSSPNKQVNSNKTLVFGPLGGFRSLTTNNDTKFLIATKQIEQVHPNIVNYQIVSAQYQVNAGVNFRINYAGLDEMTEINTIVFVGLDGVPQIMEFQVYCKQNSSVECTNQIAKQIYLGNQFVINHHPELKTYRLLSIYIESKTGQRLNFMTTFQNKVLSLRAISEVMVIQKTAKVLSFYSYLYQ